MQLKVLYFDVCDVFLSFVTFPYDVSGQVWYLIVSIPDLGLLLYFHEKCHLKHTKLIEFKIVHMFGRSVTSSICTTTNIYM